MVRLLSRVEVDARLNLMIAARMSLISRLFSFTMYSLGFSSLPCHTIGPTTAGTSLSGESSMEDVVLRIEHASLWIDEARLWIEDESMRMEDELLRKLSKEDRGLRFGDAMVCQGWMGGCFCCCCCCSQKNTVWFKMPDLEKKRFPWNL